VAANVSIPFGTTREIQVEIDPRTADYLVVKLTIGIALPLILGALLGMHFSSWNSERNATICDTLTLTGKITPQVFFEARDCLVRSTAKEKTFVVAESPGGDWESALALGMLIHRHGWNVEVVDFCASACANFIFPAGKKKYLHGESLLLYHGGPHQKNMHEKMKGVEQTLARYASPTHSRWVVNTRPPQVQDPHANMEGSVGIVDQGPSRRKVREFLAITDAMSADALFAKLVAESDRLYEELGVNILLPQYGQIGRYEPTYQAYERGGFIYRLDSLARLGVGNIEVQGGEWHPERHREYHDVYEVTYP